MDDTMNLVATTTADEKMAHADDLSRSEAAPDRLIDLPRNPSKVQGRKRRREGRKAHMNEPLSLETYIHYLESSQKPKRGASERVGAPWKLAKSHKKKVEMPANRTSCHARC